MWVVPLATALAIGIVAGMALWERGIVSCAVPVVGTMQASAPLRVVLSLAPGALFPLVVPDSLRPFWLRQAGSWPYSLRGWAWRGGLYFALGMLLAWSRPTFPCFPEGHIARMVTSWDKAGRYVTVTGTVLSWPERRGARVRYVMAVESLFAGKRQPATGRVLVSAKAYPPIAYGTQVRVRGLLRAPPTYEDFDYRRYLARRGIHAVMTAYEVIPLRAGRGSPWRRWLFAVRARGRETIARLFPEPYAALVNGILLGIGGDMPPPLAQAFNATGTTHILVISGFNISVLSGLVIALLAPWLGRRRASLVSIGAIAVYVALVGADAPVVRAGIMGTLYALGQVLGRTTFGLVSLFWAALFMMSFNPHLLWDVGFQLSMLATLGLLVLHPPLATYGQRLVTVLPERWRGHAFTALNEAVLVTLAAQLATAPLIAAVFGRTSLVAPLANALVLPVQPALMGTAAVATLAGWVWLPLGRMLSLVPQVLLAWTVFVVEELARWPGAGWPVPRWVRPLVVAYYGLFALYVGWTFLRIALPEVKVPLLLGKRLWEPWAATGRRAAVWGLGLALAVAAPLATVQVTRIPRAWHITRLPAGHVVADNWRVRLVFLTRGPHASAADEALQAVWGDKRTIWVLTHGEPDTLAALQIRARETPPALVVYPGFCVPSRPCLPHWRAFLTAMATYGVPTAALTAETAWQVTPTLAIAYADVPPSAAVHPLWLRSRDWALLIPEDIPPEVQTRLRAPDKAAHTAWVLPGIASGSWPEPEWLARLRPAVLWQPANATYPPAVTRALAAWPTRPFDPATPLTFRWPPTNEGSP